MLMMIIKFLLFTYLVISPISIYADKDFMVNECHKAQVPTVCMQCLESDPTSISANAVGITGIVLNCLDSHLQIITNNITELLSSKKNKGEWKTVLENCKKDLSTEAATKLSEAKTSLETGDYDKTGQSTKLALGVTVSCGANLYSVKFPYNELFSHIIIYFQLSDAALRIIDRV